MRLRVKYAVECEIKTWGKFDASYCGALNALKSLGEILPYGEEEIADEYMDTDELTLTTKDMSFRVRRRSPRELTYAYKFLMEHQKSLLVRGEISTRTKTALDFANPFHRRIPTLQKAIDAARKYSDSHKDTLSTVIALQIKREFFTLIHETWPLRFAVFIDRVQCSNSLSARFTEGFSELEVEPYPWQVAPTTLEILQECASVLADSGYEVTTMPKVKRAACIIRESHV